MRNGDLHKGFSLYKLLSEAKILAVVRSLPHIEHDETLVVHHTAELRTEIAIKLRVVIKPPECGPPEYDETDS